MLRWRRTTGDSAFYSSAPSDPAIALQWQFTLPVGRVAQLGARRFQRLKTIAIILWIQLALGLGVALFGYGDVHSGAIGMEHGRRMQRDFDQMRQAPEFHEPAMLTDRGYSLSRLFEDRYTSASDRGRSGLLALAAGLGASLVAGVLLLLLGRVQRGSHERTAAS